MARDTAAADDGNEAVNNGGDGSNAEGTELFGRRSYLKLAGSMAGAAGLASAASASGSDYDVIRARGQTIRIGQGERFENKLIDLSSGRSILLYVTGSNSVIRNIGFEGIYRGSQFLISINAPSRGSILFENIYMGDGATKEGSSFVHGPGAVFMHKRTRANLTFRRCNVQGFPNNGFYCSNTASGPSSVRFDTCFGKNNGVSTFRCASGNDVIENCVAYNDNTNYGRGYGGYVEANGRPVWVWNGGTVTIRNSHFADGPYPYALVAGANGSPGRVNFQSGGYRGAIQRASGSSVSVGSAVSRSPDLSIPDGVPRTPEEAASGGSGAGFRGDHDDLRHTFEFVTDGDEPTDYYFEIRDGPIEPSTYNDASIEDGLMWVSDDGTRAAGRVVDGRHAWEFDSLLVDVTVDGPAEAFVDDSPSYLSRYPRPGAAGDDWKGDMLWHDADAFDHTLLIDGVGTTDETSYEFTVSGDVEPTTYKGASISDDTEIDGGRVSGTLGGWRDAFAFDGDLESLTIDGSARVSLDGERIDPSEYGDELSHTLTIVSNGSPASYEVSVDGRLETIAWDDSSRHATIRDGRTAAGSIESGHQRFRYSGSLTDLTFAEGSAHVYADRDRVTPADFYSSH